MRSIRMYLLLVVVLLLLLLLLLFAELGKRFFSSFVSICYYYYFFFLLNVVASLRWLITVDSCAPLREVGTSLGNCPPTPPQSQH